MTIAGTLTALTLLGATTTATTTATAAPAPGRATTPPPVTATATAPALPRPTGNLAVGRDTLHLTDRSRRDPWRPSAPRELMVDVYYPAVPATGTPARYADPQEIRRYLAALGLAEVLSPQTIAATTIASRTGARPLPGHRPLVLLSPGLGVGRRSLTGLAEQLASLGLLAATIDHAYESVGTAFPGGRMLTCLACDQINGDAAFTAAARTRGADLSFVLTSLTGPHPTWRGAALVDPTRIGAVGHSLGGAGAISAMIRDPRVDVGVNMDGTVGEIPPPGALGARPVLLLGASADHPGPRDTIIPAGDDDPSWAASWQRLGPGRLWLDVDDAEHFSFTDDPVLADQLPPPPAAIPVDQQRLTGARALEITRAYVGAFLLRAFTGHTQPLLDTPSPAYPQVRVIGR
ncbi:alpha/beta hydrolase family protein [Frankia sp. AgKG'84/4]|uniref:alpha/beta hydrolase family protein n=1 Tax=Frankia sp. AgKG'84/4 TaxID=573490 RepID=UPI00200D64D0|nr:lipase [Frankia sp. AgKG'84/4]MCL9796516.1 lipase [Frankia sp. AgKG'84/4]